MACATFNANQTPMTVKTSDYELPFSNRITVADSYSYPFLENVIANNWESIQKEIAKNEIAKKEAEKKKVQTKNKRLRKLIKHVHWSGDTCIMYWSDGTQTKARWDGRELFDAEKAMLVCIARKLFENTGIYNEVLDKYRDDGYEHFEKTLIDDFDW